MNLVRKLSFFVSVVVLFASPALLSAAENIVTKNKTEWLAIGKEIAESVCAACHGADGNGISPEYPKLAGQHEDYLLKQMKEYQGRGGQPPKRTNAIMSGIIMPYSDEQLQGLAVWYASLPAQDGLADNVDSLTLGERLYRSGDLKKGIPACSGCHGPTGAGIPFRQFPKISGQKKEYIEAQLIDFRSGARANSEIMAGISSKMNDQEIKAVANYIEGLRKD